MFLVLLCSLYVSLNYISRTEIAETKHMCILKFIRYCKLFCKVWLFKNSIHMWEFIILNHSQDLGCTNVLIIINLIVRCITMCLICLSLITTDKKLFNINVCYLFFYLFWSVYVICSFFIDLLIFLLLTYRNSIYIRNANPLSFAIIFCVLQLSFPSPRYSLYFLCF